MANTAEEVHRLFEGSLIYIKAESGSKRERCSLEKLPSQKTKDPCRCPALPPAPYVPPLEQGMPTPCPGPSCTLPPATPIPLIQTLGRWVLGLNWLNTAPTYPPTQIRNDLDSGEEGRKVLEKQDLKVLAPGPRKEGANWASQGPWLLSDLSWSSCHLGGGARRWRMTHLDNGGEAELGWPGPGRMGMSLECGCSPPHQACQRTSQGEEWAPGMEGV